MVRRLTLLSVQLAALPKRTDSRLASPLPVGRDSSPAFRGRACGAASLSHFSAGVSAILSAPYRTRFRPATPPALAPRTSGLTVRWGSFRSKIHKKKGDAGRSCSLTMGMIDVSCFAAVGGPRSEKKTVCDGQALTGRKERATMHDEANRIVYINVATMPLYTHSSGAFRVSFVGTHLLFDSLHHKCGSLSKLACRTSAERQCHERICVLFPTRGVRTASASPGKTPVRTHNDTMIK